VIAPPREGPRAKPKATAIPLSPKALPRSSAGKVVVMMAGTTAMNMPAPTACTARAPMRNHIEGDSPHSADAITKRTIPIKNSLR